MNPVYKILFGFHKCLLLISFIGPFIAKVLVGAAGHSSDFSITDYLFFAYLISTAILLSIIQYAPKNETTFSKIIRYTTVAFLLIGVVEGIQTIYIDVSYYSSSIAGIFFLILNILFIISGSILSFVLIRKGF